MTSFPSPYRSKLRRKRALHLDKDPKVVTKRFSDFFYSVSFTKKTIIPAFYFDLQGDGHVNHLPVARRTVIEVTGHFRE
jgi:hypothetical protein